jgi:hypothetical protein
VEAQYTYKNIHLLLLSVLFLPKFHNKFIEAFKKLGRIGQ